MGPEMRRLRAEHSDLAMLGKAVCALVAAPEPPPNDEIEALRARLRDTLVRHLKCEDWALYPRLAASGDPALAELASRFAAEVGGIGLHFAEYDADWPSERVAADRSEEHTSELQSLMRISYAVFRLKKTKPCPS